MLNILRSSLFAAAGLALIMPVGAALADTSFSLYTGSSFTLSSDLHVQQPGVGTDATFHGVSWDSKPFRFAPYYGLRLNHFFENSPNWGVGLDYTHYKIYAQTDRVVFVNGTFNGAPVNESAPLNQRVQRFDRYFDSLTRLQTGGMRRTFSLQPGCKSSKGRRQNGRIVKGPGYKLY